MSEYYAPVRTVATAATADKPAAHLWNPHATITLRLIEIWWNKTVATADFVAAKRTTARGTATTTLTVGQSNDTENLRAPPTGAVIDTAWSADPTVAGNYFPFRWGLAAAINGAMILTFPSGILLAPGAGLLVVPPVATILQPADCTFRFLDPA